MRFRGGYEGKVDVNLQRWKYAWHAQKTSEISPGTCRGMLNAMVRNLEGEEYVVHVCFIFVFVVFFTR